jgi:hypothetical protein
MKKLIFSILLLTTIAACSHHEHGHESEKDHVKAHIDWDVEHKKTQSDYKRAASLFHWFEDHLKEHGKEISEYRNETKMFNKKLKGLGNSLSAKKLKLQQARKDEEMAEEHAHFLEDQDKFLQTLQQLETLKKELESHEGHDH